VDAERLGLNDVSAGAAVAAAVPPGPGLVEPRRPLPAGTSYVDLLGVRYAHLKTPEGGDLYLTEYGQAFWEQLLPENWLAPDWFSANRQRLVGTSTVYRVPTRPVRGIGLQLVVKWSRVGEEVPIDTLTLNKFINTEFNSPFEEVALVMELRSSRWNPHSRRVRTQKPLGIYVLPERLQLWQTGRSESRIAAKLAQHPGVELDILRQYVVLYGWVKGLDLTEVAQRWGLGEAAREAFFANATSLVTFELAAKGYRMVDMKPAHIIVRLAPDGKSLLCDRHQRLLYAVVDYELLARTPDHEQAVRSQQRQYYLQHMARRFQVPAAQPLPPHLKRTRVLGVDYIFGHAESTGGLLWVVGHDPDLFNYFLPERWRRTPRQQLSPTGQVFYTRTKDNIHLVWRVSRLGDSPWRSGEPGHTAAILRHGYNSPFEEFAYALELSRAGVGTVYPRAIYMTGHWAGPERVIADPRRYQLLAHLRTPDGLPAVSPEHEYITIWGFWNGPDELLAVHDGQFYRSVNAEQAVHQGLISSQTMMELVAYARQRLHECGFEHLNLKPDHLLLSVRADNTLVLDESGRPEFRLCNFELMRGPLPGLVGLQPG
jgi:hypothetical protein